MALRPNMVMALHPNMVMAREAHSIFRHELIGYYASYVLFEDFSTRSGIA